MHVTLRRMPISWEVEPTAGRTVVTLADPYTFQDWEQTISAMLAARACEPWHRFLVDRRHSTPPTTEFVRRMAEAFVKHAARFRGARVAVVVDTDVGFGMARMSQMMAESQVPEITIRAFRSFDEAGRWLEQGQAAV
jgi:hypothetical protein